MFKKKGFTLIELMVVIAIIGVLAAVVTPQLFRQIEKGRIRSAESFANSVKISAAAYFSDTGMYPANCDAPGMALTPCTTAPAGFITGSAATPTWDGPYLERWPTDAPWVGRDYVWRNFAWGRGIVITGAGPLPCRVATVIDTDIDGGTPNGAVGFVRYSPSPCPAGANVGDIAVAVVPP